MRARELEDIAAADVGQLQQSAVRALRRRGEGEDGLAMRPTLGDERRLLSILAVGSREVRQGIVDERPAFTVADSGPDG